MPPKKQSTASGTIERKTTAPPSKANTLGDPPSGNVDEEEDDTPPSERRTLRSHGPVHGESVASSQTGHAIAVDSLLASGASVQQGQQHDEVHEDSQPSSATKQMSEAGEDPLDVEQDEEENAQENEVVRLGDREEQEVEGDEDDDEDEEEAGEEEEEEEEEEDALDPGCEHYASIYECALCYEQIKRRTRTPRRGWRFQRL